MSETPPTVVTLSELLALTREQIAAQNRLLEEQRLTNRLLANLARNTTAPLGLPPPNLEAERAGIARARGKTSTPRDLQSRRG